MYCQTALHLSAVKSQASPTIRAESISNLMFLYTLSKYILYCQTALVLSQATSTIRAESISNLMFYIYTVKIYTVLPDCSCSQLGHIHYQSRINFILNVFIYTVKIYTVLYCQTALISSSQLGQLHYQRRINIKLGWFNFSEF